MFFGRAAQVALEVSLLLALEPDGTPRRVRDLAEELGVAATYLAKILQELARAGLLRGVRGPGGGIRLAMPAEEIHQWDVLRAVQPVSRFEQCMLGWERCHDAEPCALHETWAPIRARIVEMLQTTSLWELACKAERKGLSGNARARHPEHRG